MEKRLRLEDIGNQANTHAPPPGTEIKIAIDLSRTKWVYCVRWGGQERRRLTTPAELKHVQALVAQFPECRVHITFEACGFGYEIAWWAQEQKIEVTVIAPSRMERTPGLQVKTDRIDVGKMARKLEQGELNGIFVPARDVHDTRQVVRTYGQALKERKRAQQRIRSLMQEQGRLGPPPKAGWKVYQEWLALQQLGKGAKLSQLVQLAIRNTADRQLKVLKAHLMQTAKGEPYAKIVDALCTHSGVAQLSAIRFVLEIGDIRRFRTADSLPHYLGLTPSEYSSGELVQRGPILKCGPGSLRAALIQCAWVAVRKKGDTQLREMFERLAPRTGKKRAIVAVARRLVVRLRARWLEVLEGAVAQAA